MADEQIILDFIIKAQDQARGILAAQLQLMNQMSTQIQSISASTQKQIATAQASTRANQQQGDSLDRLIRLHDNLQKQQQRVVRGFEAMNVSLQQGGKLNQIQVGWLNSLNRAVQQNSGFMAQNGAQWNAVFAQMKVGTQLTPQLVGQFQKLGQQFQQNIGLGSQQAGMLQNVSMASTAAAAAIGGLAALIANSLIGVLQESVKQASLFANTFLGLSSVARSFGQDIQATNAAAMQLASDGLITVRDSAAGLKNLLAAGFGLPEAIELMKGFKDIASFNRQASLELGYAIVSATEGIKNQNSLLVDNAGLTKNLTIILKEMGLSEQDLAKVQTDVNVRTKLYTGLLKEMSMASGDAARLTETYAGAATALQVQITYLSAAIGEKLLPILTPIIKTLADVVGWLRNSESGVASITRYLGIAVGTFGLAAAGLTALAATAGALTGAIGLLLPALAALKISVAGLLLGAGGIAGVLALVVTGLVAWSNNSSGATEEMKKNVETAEKQREVLSRVREELIRLRDTGADNTTVQQGLRKAAWDLNEVLPSMKTNFKDLNDAISQTGTAMEQVDERFRKFSLAKINAELSNFGGTLDAQRDVLDQTRMQIAELIKQSERLDVNTAGGQRELANIERHVKSLREQEQQMVALFEAQQELNGLNAAANAYSQQAVKDAQARASVEREYSALVKGQITTQEEYNKAATKLQENLDLLVSKGMSRDAAMRIPEMVKQAKELTTSAREGVAPMNGLAIAIVRRGEAVERTRRLEQEALEHAREQENRIRSLTRAFGDYQTGVESLAKKYGLLSTVMGRARVTFDSSANQLRPFQSLMQEIVDRVEKLGETAPAEFEKIREALLRMGGSSQTALDAAANLEILRKQAAETARAMRAVASQRAEQGLEQEAEAFKQIQQLQSATLEEREKNELDSLAKRQRAAKRAFQQQTRDLDLSVDADKRVYAALAEFLSAQLVAMTEAWNTEYYGPTTAQLEQFAALAKARFEEMRDSGNYTASAIAAAWEESYDKQEVADKSRLASFRRGMRQATDAVAEMSQALADIAGETQFAELARWIGEIAQSMSMADEAGQSWRKSMKAFEDGQILQGIVGMAQAVTQFVQAMAQATNNSSRMKNIIGGAMAGAQFGAQVGGWYGAIAGAVIGGIIGAFRKPEWKRIKDQIGSELGQTVSDALAKSIAELEKKLKTTRENAIALSLSAIINESGAADFSRYEAQIDQLFALAKDASGQISKLATEELGKTFAAMITRMETSMNGLADTTMLNFIQRVRESGVAVREVTAFLTEMAGKATEAINKVTAGIVGGSVRQMGELRNLVDTVLPDLLEKEDELLDKIAGERDPVALQRLNTELEKVRDQLTKAFADADRLNGGVSRFAVTGQESFERTSRLIATTFAAGLGAGKSFIDLLKDMEPAFNDMERAMQDFGLTASEGFTGLLGLRNIVRDNKELADGIDGLNQLMKSLNNLGAINGQTFQDLGNTAKEMRDRLVEAGATGEQSLQLMQPTLQTLWELQQRFGYQTDEATQALLDEAAAAGVVGKAHMSAQERMVSGIDKLIDRMERLLGHFGVDFPKEAEAGGRVASEATEPVVDAVADVSDHLQDGIADWAAWGAAAAAAGREAYNAQMGVIYGNSPGGLIDIQTRLDILKKQWADQGTAARDGMGNASDEVNKHMEVLDKVLADLRKAGMADFQRAVTNIEEQRQAAIKQFIEDMQGAAQDLIDIGLDAINKTFDIEASKTVWEERNKQAREAAEQAKQYADALRGVQEELAREQAGDGIEGRLLALAQERQRAIEDFVERMQGASQDAIASGLAALAEIFNIRVRKAQDEHQKEIERSAADHVNTMRGLQRELEDAQIAGIADQTERTRTQLARQLDRRLIDLRTALGGETAQYHQQAEVIRQIYAQLFANIREQQDTSMRDLFRELEDAQIDRLGDSFAQQERLLRIQFDRRLADLGAQLGVESDAYRNQSSVIRQIYNELFGSLLTEQQAGLKDLQQELEDLIVAGMEDGLAKEQRLLQMEHDRRMQQLRDQFGEENAAYREQAAALEEIFRIKNERLTEEDRKGQRARVAEEVRALETAYYDLFNSAITPGQQAQRQAELAKLAEKVLAARTRAGAMSSATGSLWSPNIGNKEATGEMFRVSGGPLGYTPEPMETVQAPGKTDTLRLVLVVEDPNGRVLGETELQSVEEAITTGKIRVDVRSIVKRA